MADGNGKRVYFQFGSPTDFPGWDFDLAMIFNCLPTLPNPEGVARRTIIWAQGASRYVPAHR